MKFKLRPWEIKTGEFVNKIYAVMYNHSYEALQNKQIRWVGFQRLVNQNYPLVLDHLEVGLNG